MHLDTERFLDCEVDIEMDNVLDKVQDNKYIASNYAMCNPTVGQRLTTYNNINNNNALPMIPLSQVKVSYIHRFYQSPLKDLFSYYYTIFELIFFNYMTSLCQITFVVLLISVVNVDLFLNSCHL